MMMESVDYNGPDMHIYMIHNKMYPKYDTSVDEFSYGIMMIHMFSGRWPEPPVGQIRTENSRIIPVSEAEQHEVFLQAIENDHPLMDLIHRCINSDPQLGPHAYEIIRRISWIASQFPASFANRLEMVRQVEAVEEEKRTLTEEGEILRATNLVCVLFVPLPSLLAVHLDFCLGTEVLRHNAGSVGTSDCTVVRTYIRRTLIIFITNDTALHMLKHISHVQQIGNSKCPFKL